VFKRLLYIFLFLFTGVAAFAQQYPVQGSLAIASPYPANLSDYANSNIQNVALNLTLTDLAMNNKRVRLKLFIQTQNATIAQSIDNISGEPIIMLDGGIPQRFTNNELAHYFRLENLQGINPDGYARSLPEGIYTIGFEVYDYFTGNKLSGRISQTFWIIINDPPLLNTPTDKSKIADFTSGSGGNGGIIFNWTPRSTQVTNTEYEFTLCELWDATGDPYQQFMSAIPKYQTTVSNTTTLIYSLAQPTLISGYTYAWRVRAKAKAGFEDIGLYRNDGYSNLFTFRYGDPCPPPQSLVLETKTSDQISATWQAPLPTGSGSGEAYKIAYRKYTIAGQWNWAESETSNLFLTISNLEPSTEYEIKVGIPCNDGNSAAPLSPGRGDGGEVVFTPSQRATTLPAGQIAGIECGKEPVIDLSNQKLIENLKVGDVVMANDHPHTLTMVTGSSQGWSGESWSKESLLGGLKLKFRFSNIKVNTDKQLIDGYFESVYDDSQSNIINPGEVVNSMINDVTTLVDDINALTTKIDDFISIIDKRNPSTEEINNLNNYINTNKQTILDNLKNTSGEAAMQKADSAFQEIQEGIDCLRNEEAPTEVVTPATHGPHAAEMSSTPDCKKKIRNGEKTIDQAKNQAEQNSSEVEINCYCHDDPNEWVFTTWVKDVTDKSPCERIKKTLTTLQGCTDTQTLLISTTDKENKILTDATQCLQIDKQKISKLRVVWFKEEMHLTENTESLEKYEIDFKKTDLKEFENADKKDRGLAHRNAKGKIDFMLLIDEPDDKAFNTQREALKKYLGIGGTTEKTKPASFPIKGTQLKEIFPGTDIKRCEEVAKLINKYSDKFEINTPLRMAHFLGQIGTETGGLKKLKENTCYKNKSRIKEKFGKIFYCDLFEGYSCDWNNCGNGHPKLCSPTLKEITPSLVVKDKFVCSSLLIDYTYSCRMGNGTPASGDGSKFLGKGFIHLTGKSQYEKISEIWNADPENANNQKHFDNDDIDELTTNTETAMKASMYFWMINKLNSMAENGIDNPDIDKIGAKVNGTTYPNLPNSYDERRTNSSTTYNIITKK